MRGGAQTCLELNVDSAPGWVDGHGLNPGGVSLDASELAVRWPALTPQLRALADRFLTALVTRPEQGLWPWA